MWYVTASIIRTEPTIVTDIRVEEFSESPSTEYWDGIFKKFATKEEADDFAWEVQDRNNHWYPLLKGYRVTFENLNIIHTSMACNIKEAREYYIGHAFNFGDTDERPEDKMVKAILVERIS